MPVHQFFMESCAVLTQSAGQNGGFCTLNLYLTLTALNVYLMEGLRVSFVLLPLQRRFTHAFKMPACTTQSAFVWCESYYKFDAGQENDSHSDLNETSHFYSLKGNCGVNLFFVLNMEHDCVQNVNHFSALFQVKAFLADPSAFAVAAAPAVAADTPAAAPAAVAEQAKEESEESDEDMGFGLFD